jgi:hypothetical protein
MASSGSSFSSPGFAQNSFTASQQNWSDVKQIKNSDTGFFRDAMHIPA